MNVKEGLGEIRRRLVENQAQPETVKMVDAILQRASLPAASNASANSLLQLVRMLMRNPVANSKPAVYNDLVRLEADLESHADEFRALREQEESRPLPKTKKYYKELKKKGE
ncbi:MAG TPA: hypothetical protein VM450_18965 [Thermomicrobiales bacterium]|nr:hypothetical protein [Thermomicrobiales bacterium]